MNTGTIIAVVIIIVFLPVIAVIAYLAIKVSEMIIIAFIEILERAADRATNTYKEESKTGGGIHPSRTPPHIKTVTLDDINDEKPEQENETE